MFEGMLPLREIKPQNVLIGGDLSSKWHNPKQAAEQLDAFNNSNLFNSNNREVKIDVQVQGGFVLSGLRLGVRVGQPYILKLLNRTVPIKPDRRFYDLPLCEAEVYYIVQTGVQKLELVFSATAEGKTDFQLNLLNVFALRKNEFKLQDKQDAVRRFLQQNAIDRGG